VGQGLSTTSYAILGLLVFEGQESPGMTGYEVKQRADLTLRFYWVAPAMSQVYSELARLAAAGLVTVAFAGPGGRRDRRYRISPDGLARLKDWQSTSEPEFPILKHPVALRLLMGGISAPDAVRAMLTDYRRALAVRRAELSAVRESLVGRPELAYPALVADWGLAYYDSEDAIVAELAERLPAIEGSGASDS
jgi:DNA-binding PadR family transcriptional regulator